MPKLILVRHGQTAYNLARRYQGSVDVPLNATGEAQAHELQPRLAGIRLDAVYRSDMIRTRQTAEIILQNHPSGLTATPTNLIREVAGGEFEGLTYDQMLAQYPQELKAWEADRYNVRAPGGESLRDVQARLLEFLAMVQQEQPGENRNVLVVTHGGMVSSLMCQLLGTDYNKLWQWRVDTCSLTAVDVYERGAILSLYNDISHLRTGLPDTRL